MERTTILKPTGCDLTRLPLGALEAFVLSQLDGLLTLEEIAVVCSLELAETARIASRLVDLGAACTSTPVRSARERRGRHGPRVASEEVARSLSDPRSEQPSLRPSAPSGKASRPDPRAERPSSRSIRPSARTDRPPSRSLRPPARADRSIERPSLRPSNSNPGNPSLRPASKPLVRDKPLVPDKAERRQGSRSSHRMQRVSSRRIKAVKKSTPPPGARTRTERPSPGERRSTPAPRTSAGAAPTSAGAPTSAKAPAGDTASRAEVDRLRKLKAAAKEIEIQARVEPLLAAAEEALKANDVIRAANNFRLALQHRDDPFLRIRLEEVDRLAKAVRVQRSVACARAAEDDGRWADAALHFARAHETKPTAEIADRAANAIRLSQGDLERAATLAEQAVALEPKNPRYRMTLAEVYLAAKLLTRAAPHVEAALELAPKDPRAQELVEAIARAKKQKT